MAQVALKIDVQHVPARRMQPPDFVTHSWLLSRICKVYPHRTDRDVVGFLRGLIGSNDYLFLYQDYGVALATIAKTNPLAPKSHVEEIFVWAAPGYDPTLCASFYDDIVRWTKGLGLEMIFVGEQSDVPADLIKETLGKRVFTRQVTYTKV